MERRTAEEARRFAKLVKAKYATGTYTYSSLSRELDCSIVYVRNIVLGNKVVRHKPPEGNRKRLVVHGVAFYVYDDGRIWSCSLNRFMVPPKEGYHNFCVYRNGVNHKIRAHRLVLTAHKRPPKKGEVARHLDDDPTNNHISNLDWGTDADNTEDKRKNGNMPKGIDVVTAKLNDDLVTELRKEYKGGNYLIYIDKFRAKHGLDVIDETLIAALFNNMWKHVPDYGVMRPEIRSVRPIINRPYKKRVLTKPKRVAAYDPNASKFVQKLTEDAARRIHRNWIKYQGRYPSRKAFAKSYALHLEREGTKVHFGTVVKVVAGISFPKIYKEFYNA